MEFRRVRASISRIVVILASSAVALLAFSSSAQGQICPGSHLTYIVRDAKGVAIDAAGKGLSFEKDGGSPYTWEVSDGNFASDRMKAPDQITNLSGKISTLNSDGMCIFKHPLSLRLTLNGVTMNLTFIMPRLTEYESRSFLVDSRPFQAGNFEIELPSDPDQRWRFYPATGWRKAIPVRPVRR